MKKALISVSDKTHIVEFAKGLHACGYQIISTGGTYALLKKENIDVIKVEDVTAFPEILDGRVKTLHPTIFAGLLALKDNVEHQDTLKNLNIDQIDLVCVNLYPFKETIAKENVTLQEAIENIDIGGPSMLRAACKNYQRVTVIHDVNDYELVLKEIQQYGDTLLETRLELAVKVFAYTSYYDSLITRYLSTFTNKDYYPKVFAYEKGQSLRYGENPHQKAYFLKNDDCLGYSIANSKQLHGKELSYNNLQDAQAALNIIEEFHGDIACVALKHTNPCGVALGSTVLEAYTKAYQSDPISIFGGIVAFNQTVDKDIAQKLHELFIEIVLAPEFTQEALDILTAKKNIRLMTYLPKCSGSYQKVTGLKGGLLVQDSDDVNCYDLTTVTHAQASKQELDDLLFAYKVCKHVKSNAIVIAKNLQTIGVGAGQMNRIQAASIALKQAGKLSMNAVLASDAFFPMDDTVQLASTYGIKAIMQPGGSIRDQDSIDQCNKHNIAMIFTKVRHFLH